jgi:hypothetical protein
MSSILNSPASPFDAVADASNNWRKTFLGGFENTEITTVVVAPPVFPSSLLLFSPVAYNGNGTGTDNGFE